MVQQNHRGGGGTLKALAIVVIAVSVCLIIPAARSALISVTESILRRQINHEVWNSHLLFMALGGLFLSGTLLFSLWEKAPALLAAAGKKPRLFTVVEILLIAFFIGEALFLAASNKSIWCDEAYSLAPIQRSWQDLMACVKLDVHPPLFFALEKCWATVFGDGIFTMKILSIIPMTLSLIFGCLFLKKEFSRTASLLFALCFLASETIIHYSIEIRMYAWAFFFVTMAALCAWYIITNGKIKWFALFILCAEGAAYTHYYAAAAVAIGYILLFIYFLAHDRKNIYKIALAGLAGIALYAPWLPSMFESFSTHFGNFWIGPITLYDIAKYIFLIFASGGILVTPLCILLFCAVFCVFLAKKQKDKKDYFIFGGFACLILLAAAAILASLLTHPVLVAHYLFPACGLLWLFFAVESASIKNISVTGKRAFIFMCGLLLYLGLCNANYSISNEKKEDREFMRFYDFMAENIRPDDAFIFTPDQGQVTGVIACLFPGHEYLWPLSDSLSETCWEQFGSKLIDSAELSDIDRFQGRGVWLIASAHQDNNFERLEEARAQWQGVFGWGIYWGGCQFNLYRIDFPAALAGLFNEQ
jgi:hypothetical protein